LPGLSAVYEDFWLNGFLLFAAACSSKERQDFNTELVRVFSDEYERMLKARGPEAVSEY
jgi:hypothetical protein